MPRSTHGIRSDIRRDIRAAVSAEFERNATNALHRIIVQGQGGNGNKNLLVSDACSLSVTE